jgi:hypothetical protein
MNDKPETERKSSEPGQPQDQIRREQAIEVFITAILALATIATAWSGYQAARWGGLQSTLYSEAGTLRTESARASSTVQRLAQIDLIVYTSWAQAFATGNQDLADFWEQRFRPEFKSVFEAWMASDPMNNPDAPAGPFAMPEYDLSLADKAIELEEEAALTFQQGKDANQRSDQYIFNTVILASVLFLAGITSRFNWLPVRVTIALIASAILVYGLFNIATYPIL